MKIKKAKNCDCLKLMKNISNNSVEAIIKDYAGGFGIKAKSKSNINGIDMWEKLTPKLLFKGGE